MGRVNGKKAFNVKFQAFDVVNQIGRRFRSLCYCGNAGSGEVEDVRFDENLFLRKIRHDAAVGVWSVFGEENIPKTINPEPHLLC